MQKMIKISDDEIEAQGIDFYETTVREYFGAAACAVLFDASIVMVKNASHDTESIYQHERSRVRWYRVEALIEQLENILHFFGYSNREFDEVTNKKINARIHARIAEYEYFAPCLES